MRRLTCFALLFAITPAILSQSHAPVFNSLPPIAFDNSGPVIRAHTEALKPFTVAGERGVLVGQQDGTFEAWLLPAKILSHLTIEADVEGYTVPIDVNQQSAEIEVRPDRTTITYAHIAFTVRQIMFSPAAAPAGAGPVVLFEFDCLHPTDFTLRFTPELRWMWPERNEGVPGVEWVPGFSDGKELPGGMNGFYVLHSDYPDFAAAVTIPEARPGILAPYQERPQVRPVELKLHIDPARDHGKLFPLLMAYGANVSAANSSNLAVTLENLNAAIPDLYKTHAENWKKTLAGAVSIDTPDKALNEAFQWAVISIEQLKTKTIPGQSAAAANASPSGQDSSLVTGHDSTSQPAGGTTSVSGHDFSRAEQGPHNTGASAPAGAPGLDSQTWDDETALVAGYYSSADSARPGFGWFFGRDALYTLYAVNGYGDFSLSKSELEFLIRRQRADGKIMHEWSQTAAAINWRSFPYMYAAADSTPLFLLATLDYVRASGDVAFLTAHSDAVEKAWEFETSHAPDSAHGGNGIYENTQGTGWVESWPGGLPHQEIYLAALDQQASGAMAQIESLLGDKQKSDAAQSRAAAVAKTIEEQFYDPQKDCYAFSRNADGTLDHASTVYPALAWWSSPSVTKNAAYLAHPEGCLKQFAAHTLNTDWGLRDVSNEEKIYDGMSYHQGSVWPLFTGWAALAEYRGNQPLAGYQMLMENANLTWAQDLGADTELLSGDFYVPFGRSTSHQLWSSAMVITPTLRGLFGIDIDAQTKTVTVNPHLPASWGTAKISHLAIGNDTVDLLFTQSFGEVAVRIQGANGGQLKLATSVPGAQLQSEHIEIPPPAIQIEPAFSLALPGTRTESMRILNQTVTDRGATLLLEGPAGSQFRVPLFLNWHLRKLDVTGAEEQPLDDSEKRRARIPQSVLTGHFPPGEGWKTITVTLTW